MSAATKHVVIVGGGFAGVYAARYLQGRLPAGWGIVLFSKENHFIFTPLLGDVVGSSINPMHVVCPIRQMARGATCRTAELVRIDLAGKAVEYRTPAGERARQPYEHLVLASGSVTKLDIVPGMAAHGWPLKTMGDALLLRNHLIGQLEKAEVETNSDGRRRLLSVAVVGGGFSGVEVAGEINDLLRSSSRFYRNLLAAHAPTNGAPRTGPPLTADIHVTLLQGRERILPELPDKLASFAHSRMSRNGIDIRVNAVAADVSENGVRLKDGSFVEAGTVVCTIGTSANPLVAALGLPMEYNRLKTEPDMRVKGQVNVWALGDCAAVPNAFDGKPAAPTAQIAVRQAKQLAANLRRIIDGETTKPFTYRPLGMMASIGNQKAVGLMMGMRVSGFVAWFMWRGIYLSKMPTLARKMQIAFDWAWQLFFPRDLVQLNLKTTDRFNRAHFETGQFVFHKDEAGEKFYVIERGQAGVYLDEKAPPVAVLQPGDYFGEGAALFSGKRSASVKAEANLDVLVLDKESLGVLTKNLDFVRKELERANSGRQSVNELLEVARRHPLLDTIHVREVMSKPVTCLPVSLTLDEALAQAQALGKGAYPIVDAGGGLAGLCTRSDFYRALQKFRPRTTPLAEVMTAKVMTVPESETLTATLMCFMRAPIKRLVVVADDNPRRPIGMVTPFDIVRLLGQDEIKL